MTPKWIEAVEDLYVDGEDWEEMYKIFESVNKLLERAMLGTEDADLHDDILKEILDE